MMPHDYKRISVLLLTIIIIINLECIQMLLQKYAEKNARKLFEHCYCDNVALGLLRAEVWTW